MFHRAFTGINHIHTVYKYICFVKASASSPIKVILVHLFIFLIITLDMWDCNAHTETYGVVGLWSGQFF